jgi:hypothetical protein
LSGAQIAIPVERRRSDRPTDQPHKVGQSTEDVRLQAFRGSHSTGGTKDITLWLETGENHTMPRTDRSVSRRSAIIRLAAMALSGLVPIEGQTKPAARRALNPARFAGAFVNWGPHGREVMLQEWEKWLNQAPSSVLGVDYYAQSTWEDFFGLNWVPGIWRKLNPARNVIWSVPLTVKGTALKDVADGLHDAEFEAAAKAISEAQPKAIIRLGWEMNVQSMAWFAKDQEADYISAFRRVVGIFRQHSNELKYDWCPGWGPQDSPADLTYPGDDVVDYVGLDVYDYKFEGSAAERWVNFYLKSPFGLQWHKQFAARHDKLMSYPEWGVGNFGDNPFFIRQMHAWFVENESNIVYAAYFDVDGAWPTQIDNNQFPESQKLFQKLFGRDT